MLTAERTFVWQQEKKLSHCYDDSEVADRNVKEDTAFRGVPLILESSGLILHENPPAAEYIYITLPPMKSTVYTAELEPVCAHKAIYKTIFFILHDEGGI